MIRALFVLMAALAATVPARAEWRSVSEGLSDPDVRLLAAHPRVPDRLYAASARTVYKTVDGGASWKRVLSSRGDGTPLRVLKSDPRDPEGVYVGGDKGLKRSVDGGRKWSTVFRGIGERSRTVQALAFEPEGGVWIGTAEGLFRYDPGTGASTKLDTFPDVPVQAIEDDGAALLVAADDGIYASTDRGRSWEMSFHRMGAADERGESTLAQFDVEEFALSPFFSQIAVLPGGRAVASTRDGLLRSEAGRWERFPTAVPAAPVRGVALTPAATYAATEKGVYRVDVSGGAAEDVSRGLPASSASAVAYDGAADALYAATPAGVFRYAHPELRIAVPAAEGARRVPTREEVMARFTGEPGIAEVQAAAVRYAEVHPDKIEAWRRAAARKALLPNVSLGADWSRDQNVDLDRGGTNDPDRFIIGPEEKSLDWSFGVSWNLGELIWNDDQTSIDTRSRLMVELRDDVLSEVTHLYYERRRLQVHRALAPDTRELPVLLEEDLKLEELTARIDALTGGYLSARLGGKKA